MSTEDRLTKIEKLLEDVVATNGNLKTRNIRFFRHKNDQSWIIVANVEGGRLYMKVMLLRPAATATQIEFEPDPNHVIAVEPKVGVEGFVEEHIA